jgi:hypothetical protein
MVYLSQVLHLKLVKVLEAKVTSRLGVSFHSKTSLRQWNAG